MLGAGVCEVQGISDDAGNDRMDDRFGLMAGPGRHKIG